MNGQSAQNVRPFASLAVGCRPQDAVLTERETHALAHVARQEYEARRRRARYIDPSLLGEPAWDILLDLFISAAENRLVSVTSSAIAAQVPQTTALRYFASLVAAGLIRRQKSKTDARVTFLELTDEGRSRVGSYLQDRSEKLLERPAGSLTVREVSESRCA